MFICWWKTEDQGECRNGVLGVFSTIEAAIKVAEDWVISQEGNWDEHAASVTTTVVDNPQPYIHPSRDNVWESD